MMWSCRRLRLGVVFLRVLASGCVEAFGRAMTGRRSHHSTQLRQRPGYVRAGWRDATSLLTNIGGRLARLSTHAFGPRDGGVWTTFGNWFSRNRGRISFFLIQTPSPIARVAVIPVARRPASSIPFHGEE